MSQTITFRPTRELAGWIEQASAQLGISQGQFIRSHLAEARRLDNKAQKFMRLAGVVRGGSRDVSTRKGFSTK
jgi:hypothetical protein